jgi:AcrR family transcriptional regulator
MVKPPPPAPVASNVVHFEAPARPRKRPRQARSIMLVNALKQTGRDIIEHEGRDALTLLRLSEHAGVAVSSIYQYFPTIDSLIVAIFEDFRAEARQKLADDIRALPAGATLFDALLMALTNGIATIRHWAMLDRSSYTAFVRFDELVRLDLVKPEHTWLAVTMTALVARFPDAVAPRHFDKIKFLLDESLPMIVRAVALKRPDYLNEADTALLIARMLHALLTTPG